MKIKFGAFITDGRGKIGGHVASKNRSGSYLRTKVTPSNPQSSFQSAIRSYLGSLSSNWSVLLAAQRESWNAAVNQWSSTDIFGDIKNPTGKNLYTKLNINLLNTGQTILEVAPEKIIIAPVNATGAAINLTATTGLLIGVSNQDDSVVLISATPPQSAGTTFYKGKFRDILFGNSDAVVTLDFYDAYVARFGVPTAGANIAVSVKQVGVNGQSTTPQTFIATVTA